MQPNPYVSPWQQGYQPPAYKLPVRTSAILFSTVFVGVVVFGLGAGTYLPRELFGMDRIWVITAGELLIICLMWALLMLGRAAGLIESPVSRARP